MVMLDLKQWKNISRPPSRKEGAELPEVATKILSNRDALWNDLNETQ